MPTSERPTLAEHVAEVSAQLQRIEKRGTAPSSMGGFAFVQIVDVMDALKPELDKRSIILRPLYRQIGEPLVRPRGETGYLLLITVELELYAVRGSDELLLARTLGMGADTQDKATGKAQTSALKEAILKAFAIPTGLDPEAHEQIRGGSSQRRTSSQQRPEQSQSRASSSQSTRSAPSEGKAADVAQINELLKHVDALDSQTINRYSVRAHVRRELGLDSIGEVLSKGTDAQRQHVVEYLRAKLAETSTAETMDDDEALAAGAALAGRRA
jgi:hypothetical protein